MSTPSSSHVSRARSAGKAGCARPPEQQGPAAFEAGERRAFRGRAEGGLELGRRQLEPSPEVAGLVLHPGRVEADDEEREPSRQVELDGQVAGEVRQVDVDTGSLALRQDASFEPRLVGREEGREEGRVALVPEGLAQLADVFVVVAAVVLVEDEVAEGVQDLLLGIRSSYTPPGGNPDAGAEGLYRIPVGRRQCGQELDSAQGLTKRM
jgi:hypothetical protein